MGCAQSQTSPKSSTTPSPASTFSSPMSVVPYSGAPLTCPVHPPSYAQPLSCAHCMAASAAFQSFAAAHSFRASSSPLQHHPHHHPPPLPFPLVTARQITSHWSSRYTQEYPPVSLPSFTRPVPTPSTLSRSPSPHSFLSSPHSHSSPHSSHHHHHHHTPIRHKATFYVDDEPVGGGSGGGWGGEELSVLKEQVSVFRERRRREVQEVSSSAGGRSDSGGEEGREREREREGEREEYVDHEEDKGGEDDYDLSVDRASSGEVSGALSKRATTSRHLTLVREEKGEDDEVFDHSTAAAAAMGHFPAGLESHIDVRISV